MNDFEATLRVLATHLAKAQPDSSWIDTLTAQQAMVLLRGGLMMSMQLSNTLTRINERLLQQLEDERALRRAGGVETLQA